MASIRGWNWYHLVGLWGGAFLLFFAVLFIQASLMKPVRWLLPYPTSWRSIRFIVRALWEGAPLLAIELAGIPLLAVGITLYWLVSKVRL